MVDNWRDLPGVRMSQPSAEYRLASPTAYKTCENCRMYVKFAPQLGCLLVRGVISPRGTCNKWEGKKQ